MARSKLLRNFLPFGVLVIGAFVGLAQFRQANYGGFGRPEPIVFKEQLTRAGMQDGSYQALTTQSIEGEYDKMMKKIDIDNWKNIPGPQPGEDSRKKQEEFRKKNP